MTPWTVSHQAPLSMGFPRQEHWNGFPFPSLGDLLGPGIEPTSSELAGRFFTTEPLGKPSCRLLVGFKTRKVHCCEMVSYRKIGERRPAKCLREGMTCMERSLRKVT